MSSATSPAGPTPAAAGGGLYGADSDSTAFEFNAPVNFGNMFGPNSIDDEKEDDDGNTNKDELQYSIESHTFPGRTLKIRQFDDHITNANAVWPESRFLAGWLCGEGGGGSGIVNMDRVRALLIDQQPGNPSAIYAEEKRNASRNTNAAPSSAAPSCSPSSTTAASPSSPLLPLPAQKRVLELGSACGALSIFLSLLGVSMTASDINDPIVTGNIEYNAKLNDVPPHLLRTLPHTWGIDLTSIEKRMREEGPFDVILASDILNYEDQFENLVKTLCVLMPRPANSAATDSGTAPSTTAASLSPSTSSPSPSGCIFRMVWKRRSKGKDQERSFFDLLKAQHFHVDQLPSKVFEIRRI